jgi:hypothetical protein
VNNAAVTAAPSHTSFQATFASGRTLKISANSTLIIPNETMAVSACQTIGAPGKLF